ncbi:MAG: hypothetical protein PVI21_04280 [Candidatus Woesebacteria bacterium]|jgi:hypothetical protein
MTTIQLNLLPDVKKEYLKSQKNKAMVISGAILVTIASVAISVLLVIYVLVGQQLQMSIITGEIKDKTTELNNVQNLEKYLTIQNQLAALPGLHDGKGAYSRMFTFLPILNPSAPNNVKLSVFQLSAADSEGAAYFTGTTATYESLNVFLDTLNNAEVTYTPQGSTQPTVAKMFTSAIVQSSSLASVNNVSTVSFTIRAIYDPAVFDATNTDVTASVPNIVTTPSVTGSPLFEQSGEQ